MLAKIYSAFPKFLKPKRTRVNKNKKTKYSHALFYKGNIQVSNTRFLKRQNSQKKTNTLYTVDIDYENTYDKYT